MYKKIREAAENDLHTFKEDSWRKMEPLLDKHLPQENKRRRFIFFFLVFSGIGIATAGAFMIAKNTNEHTSTTAQKSKSGSFR